MQWFYVGRKENGEGAGWNAQHVQASNEWKGRGGAPAAEEMFRPVVNSTRQQKRVTLPRRAEHTAVMVRGATNGIRPMVQAGQAAAVGRCEGSPVKVP